MKPLLTLSTLALFALSAPAFSGQVPGAHFVENFDDNGDGQVTLAEVREKRGDILYMFDQNDDGILSSEEYDMFDEARAADHADQEGGGHGQGGNAGEGMSREVTDLNGDGQVTLEEFQTATEAWFTQKDRNGDGVITTADFGPRNG